MTAEESPSGPPGRDVAAADRAADRATFVRATWVNVLGNILKILVEGSVGLAFGSLALVADAAHSLADLLASLVVLIWGRLAFESPDTGHPHGHERIEPLTALFVGATLIALAVKLVLDTVQAIRFGSSVTFDPILVAGLAFAIADMLAVYWYTVRLNERVNSPSLSALATDCLNDVFTSAAAAVGVFGVAMGYPVLDAVAGGLVAILVAYQGVEVSRENLAYLIGSAPAQDRVDAVSERVLAHDRVRGLHDLQVYYQGPVLEVEFHAEVDGDMTLRAAHDLETELRQDVMALDDVGDAHVHLDPSGMGEWKTARDADPTSDGHQSTEPG